MEGWRNEWMNEQMDGQAGGRGQTAIQENE